MRSWGAVGEALFDGASPMAAHTDRLDRAVSETAAWCFRELATSYEGCVRPPLAKRILYSVR